MKVEPHHDLDELRQLVRHEKDSRVKLRLLAVVQAARGCTTREIAEANDYSLRAVQQWVRRYNEGGVENLSDRPRSGRPKKLTPSQERALLGHLENKERQGVKYSGEGIRRYIRQEFKVKYSLDGVYKMLHRLGVGLGKIR